MSSLQDFFSGISCVSVDFVNDNTRNKPRLDQEGPPCDTLTESLLHRIYSYLPFPELVMCRQVSTSWSQAVGTSEAFLSTSCLHVSLESGNSEVIALTHVPWRHIRLKLYDIQEHLNKGQRPTLPPCNFLQNIKTIEFRQCIVGWNTIKTLILSTQFVDHLIITRCLFQDLEPVEIDADLYLAVFGQMSKFTFTDVADVRGITACLQKLVVYAASNIEMLEIHYNPYFSQVSPELAAEFCTVLGQLLQKNATTIRSLVLDIRCTEILNFFCPIVLSRLETYYCVMKLEVFELAKPIFGGHNVSINYEAPRALLMLSELFSILPTLKSVAIPHLQNLGPYESRRWQIAEHITRKVQKLRVPGPFYLRRNFLKNFNCLKEFFIGEKTCPGPVGLLNPVKYVYDYRTGIVKANCRNVLRLGIFARINYESGKLYHIMEKFPLLIKFELDAFRPLVDDKDVQAMIKGLPLLKHISIIHCDLITDQGFTGIPLQTCKTLFKLSTIYTDPDLQVEKLRTTGGVPLSNLKGLVTLNLCGSAKVTDVGLKLGVEFIGLTTLYLPWSERITEWGIRKLGEQNPSLYSLTLTGATPSTVIGCTQLLNEHNRLAKQNLRILSIKEQQNDEFASSSLLTGILWDN